LSTRTASAVISGPMPSPGKTQIFMLIPVKQRYLWRQMATRLLHRLLDGLATLLDILADPLYGIASSEKCRGGDEAQQLFHGRLQKKKIIAQAQYDASVTHCWPVVTERLG
jgi:hypothetical protein